MKFLIAALLLAGSAHASVQAFLEKDPVVFYVQDDETNADATEIFYNLDVKAHGEGTMEKEFTTLSGNYSVLCSYSPTNLKSSCIIRIKKTPELDMSNEYAIIYSLYDTDDATDIYLHSVKDSDGITNYYLSEKEELSINSSADRFMFVYFKPGL